MGRELIQKFKCTAPLLFHIVMLFLGFLAFMLTFVLVGFFMLPVIVIMSIVFPIFAAIKASEGDLYNYPFL